MHVWRELVKIMVYLPHGKEAHSNLKIPYGVSDFRTIHNV